MSALFTKTKKIFRKRNMMHNFYWKIITCDPSVYTMDYPKLIASSQKKNPLVHKGLTVFDET